MNTVSCSRVSMERCRARVGMAMLCIWPMLSGTTGWQYATLDLGALSAGPHTWAVVTYNNQSSSSSGITNLWIHGVTVQA